MQSLRHNDSSHLEHSPTLCAVRSLPIDTRAGREFRAAVRDVADCRGGCWLGLVVEICEGLLRFVSGRNGLGVVWPLEVARVCGGLVASRAGRKRQGVPGERQDTA
ncbi:MAG: hypothetical protein GY832_37905 [Chloroflexi bacterium]|nr:hypothetical protein [Chloroflexota bacterium]